MNDMCPISAPPLTPGLPWPGWGELAILDAKLKNTTAVQELLALVQAPYNEHPARQDKAGLPPDWASKIEISCSS